MVMGGIENQVLELGDILQVLDIIILLITYDHF